MNFEIILKLSGVRKKYNSEPKTEDHSTDLQLCSKNNNDVYIKEKKTKKKTVLLRKPTKEKSNNSIAIYKS